MLVYPGNTCDDLERKKRLGNVGIVLLSLFAVVLLLLFTANVVCCRVVWGPVIAALPEAATSSAPTNARNVKRYNEFPVGEGGLVLDTKISTLVARKTLSTV